MLQSEIDLLTNTHALLLQTSSFAKNNPGIELPGTAGVYALAAEHVMVVIRGAYTRGEVAGNDDL